MPFDSTSGRRAGLISADVRDIKGTLRTAATTARAGRLESLREQVREIRPDLDPVEDAAEIDRLAGKLERVQLRRRSAAGVKARKLKRQLAALEAELNASSLEDAGSDGIDL